MTILNNIKIRGTWREVADAARTTINKKQGTNEPSSRWKKNILLAEHSPIRQLNIKWKWSIKSWISVHFVRHKIGIEHFVSTQREDITGKSRDDKPQDSLVIHECIANAQAIINISRKRLCTKAHFETRAAWKEVLKELEAKEPELVSVCVPECVYRGFCPEMKGCGFSETIGFQQILTDYRRK
jgi:hypothetical protein